MPYAPRSRVLVVLAAGVLLGGCGSAPDTGIRTVFDACAPLGVAPQAPVTAAERESVARGLALWNAAAGTALTESPGPADPTVPVVFEDGFPAQLGFYDDATGTVYVNHGLDGDPAGAVVVAHELGHAFGLGHVDPAERLSVMNPGNEDVTPTAEDVAALRALWGACDEGTSG